MTTDFSCVSQKEDFLLLNIKVQPGAQRNEIKGFRNDRWLLRIKGVPEKGKVNLNLYVFLSKQLSIPQAEIQLV
ncbi:MAG: DUF167 domain-containing protein, partial [Spirochaetaceae bacterium]|nr:DUF167 domain-containing protein [Spirochaetaceae bacterium]